MTTVHRLGIIAIAAAFLGALVGCSGQEGATVTPAQQQAKGSDMGVAAGAGGGPSGAKVAGPHHNGG